MFSTTKEKDLSSYKKAAVDPDEFADKELGEISAADFLTALQSEGASLAHLKVWPDKKKYEFFFEPENIVKLKVVREHGVLTSRPLGWHTNGCHPSGPHTASGEGT